MLMKVLTENKKPLCRKRFDDFSRLFKSLSLRQKHHPKKVVFLLFLMLFFVVLLTFRNYYPALQVHFLTIEKHEKNVANT